MKAIYNLSQQIIADLLKYGPIYKAWEQYKFKLNSCNFMKIADISFKFSSSFWLDILSELNLMQMLLISPKTHVQTQQGF